MNKYELALVVSAKVEEDVKLATVENAKNLITRFGGVVTDVKDFGKRRLAYDINKEQEGYYFFIQFDAEANVPDEIEQRARIMDNVLRYLCVRQDEQ